MLRYIHAQCMRHGAATILPSSLFVLSSFGAQSLTTPRKSFSLNPSPRATICWTTFLCCCCLGRGFVVGQNGTANCGLCTSLLCLEMSGIHLEVAPNLACTIRPFAHNKKGLVCLLGLCHQASYTFDHCPDSTFKGQSYLRQGRLGPSETLNALQRIGTTLLAWALVTHAAKKQLYK